MKSLIITLASSAMFITSACVITGGTASTGTGGGGGTDKTTSSATTGGHGGAGGAAVGVGGGGGAGGAAACQSCGTAITPPDGDPGMLCTGTSSDLYDKYAACICDAANCATDCDGTCAAMGKPNTDQGACDTCVMKSNTGNCANDFNACANDI